MDEIISLGLGFGGGGLAGGGLLIFFIKRFINSVDEKLSNLCQRSKEIDNTQNMLIACLKLSEPKFRNNWEIILKNGTRRG